MFSLCHKVFRVQLIGHTVKNLFAGCTNGKDITHGKAMVCRVLFLRTTKNYFVMCFFLAREKVIKLPCIFFGTRLFLAHDNYEIQSTFWSHGLIQIKKCSHKKLYNFLGCTTFILVISSFDKALVTLFTKSISSHIVFWRKIYTTCEQCYYHYFRWTNDQNESCRHRKVMKLCSWQFLFIWNLLVNK